MSGRLLHLYHRLPPAARDMVASVRGLYLRRWRYGPETETLVEAALDRDTWSDTRWQQWREERLSYVLHRAATRVPFYRDRWAARRRRGDQSSWDLLENWPLLSKDELRGTPKAFIADDCNPRWMFHEHTSGTTGQHLDLWWGRATVRAWYGLAEARCRRWHGVSRNDRWAILGGQLVTPVHQRHPPFWAWNAALRQLYMSSYHLAPDLLPHYLDALRRYEIRYIWGYPSAIFELAQAALRQVNRTITLTTVIANAEPLFDHQVRVIEDAFGCTPRETYGMAEIVANASDCREGSLHWWPEVGWVESGDERDAIDGSRDLVCTGLLNADMPLIRYRVGDRAVPPHGSGGCPCGRTLPLVGEIMGRSDDVLCTPDGRRIGRLDPVFKAGLPIQEAQIIQDALDRIRVRYVAVQNSHPDDERRIVTQIQARMGPVDVTLERVPQIPRTAAGKFRAVVSNLPAAARAAALGANDPTLR